MKDPHINTMMIAENHAPAALNTYWIAGRTFLGQSGRDENEKILCPCLELIQVTKSAATASTEWLVFSAHNSTVQDFL